MQLSSTPRAHPVEVALGLAGREVRGLSWPHKARMTERLYSTSPLTRNMMKPSPFSEGESHWQDDFKKSQTTISVPLRTHRKRQTFIFPKRKMSWLCWQWHRLWSADSPASLPIPALPAMERVLINKATNAMERENKGKKREAEGAGEHGGL